MSSLFIIFDLSVKFFDFIFKYFIVSPQITISLNMRVFKLPLIKLVMISPLLYLMIADCCGKGRLLQGIVEIGVFHLRYQGVKQMEGVHGGLITLNLNLLILYLPGT